MHVVCHTDRKEVTTTNERIKKLRKTLGLTQQAFADRIGVKRNTVATYELGRNTPIDAVVGLICREFRVNEEWLRNGTGEMFLPASRDVMDELIEQYGLPREFRALIDKFLDLKPDQRDAVVEYMRDVATALMTEDSTTAAAPYVPPGYSSRAELEAEADAFAAMAREQFLSEKIPGYQAYSAKKSDEPGDLLA